MADNSLSNTLDSLLQGLACVIESLQERRDYSARRELASAVTAINALKQSLLNYKAATGAAEPVRSSLLAEALTAARAVDTTYANLIAANLAMASKGILNTDRTIEPEEARAQNKIVTASRSQIQELVATLQAKIDDKVSKPDTGPSLSDSDIESQREALQQAALSGAPFVAMLQSVEHALQASVSKPEGTGGI